MREVGGHLTVLCIFMLSFPYIRLAAVVPLIWCKSCGSEGWLACEQVVSRDIRTLLTARAKYFNLLLDDVSITNLTFSREYTGAVEAKQVAQQESERAKFIVRCLSLKLHALCHVLTQFCVRGLSPSCPAVSLLLHA